MRASIASDNMILHTKHMLGIWYQAERRNIGFDSICGSWADCVCRSKVWRRLHLPMHGVQLTTAGYFAVYVSDSAHCFPGTIDGLSVGKVC